MVHIYKSKFAIIIISVIIFIIGLINIINNGFFSQTIKINELTYTYNIDNQKISVFIGGAVENSGWFECTASTTYNEIFKLAKVISAANISFYNLSNKINDYDENYQKIIIIESDFESAFNINTCSEADMLIEGIPPEIIANIVIAREHKYLNIHTLVSDGVLTNNQFSKYKYRFYSF
jgi:hypothetical protein